jgi:hypothetical protein
VVHEVLQQQQQLLKQLQQQQVCCIQNVISGIEQFSGSADFLSML